VGISKYWGTSICDFVPNLGLRKFRRGKSIALSTNKLVVDGRACWRHLYDNQRVVAVYYKSVNCSPLTPLLGFAMYLLYKLLTRFWLTARRRSVCGRWTQPCIPPGSLNRVSASAGSKISLSTPKSSKSECQSRMARKVSLVCGCDRCSWLGDVVAACKSDSLLHHINEHCMKPSKRATLARLYIVEHSNSRFESIRIYSFCKKIGLSIH